MAQTMIIPVLILAALAFPLLLKVVNNPPPEVKKLFSLRYSTGTASIRDIIWSLNDTPHWSRERIADWVETIENQQQVAEQAVAAEAQEAMVP